MAPKLPDAKSIEVRDDQDRREVLATWLASPTNPFFARVAANRIWGHLMGRGIVDPVDDFNAANPPSNPELLDYLAAEFRQSGFDQQALIRQILNSTTYQLSSVTNASNQKDDRYFSHARARLLEAEQLYEAISFVTDGVRPSEPMGDTAGHDFMLTFGRPSRSTVCDCERTDGPNLARALELINGSFVPSKVKSPHNRIGQLFLRPQQRVSAAGAPPADDLVAWFRADAGVFNSKGMDVTDSPLADAQVAKWKNHADEAKSVVQADANRQPTWRRNGAGGLPTLRWDGTSDWLHNKEDNVVEPGSPRTLFVVASCNDGNGGALFTFGRQTGGGGAIFTAQHVIAESGTYLLYSDGVNGAGNTSTLRPFARVQAPFITSFTSAGPGEKLAVTVNGDNWNPIQPGGIGLDSKSVGFTIASREDIPIGNQLWNGEISELLIYDVALNLEQQKDVGAYLTTKYALKTSYPMREVPNAVVRFDDAMKLADEILTTAYSRPPTKSERASIERHLRSGEDLRSPLEDVLWAILNSKEFLFQH